LSTTGLPKRDLRLLQLGHGISAILSLTLPQSWNRHSVKQSVDSIICRKKLTHRGPVSTRSRQWFSRDLQLAIGPCLAIPY